jgi:cell division protein FtsB
VSRASAHGGAPPGRREGARPARRTVVVTAAVVLLAGGLAVYGGNGVIRVRAMQAEIQALEREVTTLRARTEKLTATVDKLRNDPAYIEKLAREDLGYVREGETVLKFPATKPK